MIGAPLFNRIAAARGWRADLLALGLGALSAAALPPLYVIPVLLLAVPGLLALIGGTRGMSGSFRRGFLFGLGHHIFGLYWITEAIMLEAGAILVAGALRGAGTLRPARAVHRGAVCDRAARPAGLAPRGDAGRRMDPVRPRAAICRHRLPVESMG